MESKIGHKHLVIFVSQKKKNSTLWLAYTYKKQEREGVAERDRQYSYV